MPIYSKYILPENSPLYQEQDKFLLQRKFIPIEINGWLSCVAYIDDTHDEIILHKDLVQQNDAEIGFDYNPQFQQNLQLPEMYTQKIKFDGTMTDILLQFYNTLRPLHCHHSLNVPVATNIPTMMVIGIKSSNNVNLVQKLVQMLHLNCNIYNFDYDLNLYNFHEAFQHAYYINHDLDHRMRSISHLQMLYGNDIY